ncbi:MAG TPA: hypothetical protein PLD59_14480 [Tepidisphaeraceae bacterium]|nr:hypothetical protein [Tepidisphaeraceae bacterium]
MEWAGRPALAFMAAKEEDRFSTFLVELLRYRPLLERFCSFFLKIAVPADVDSDSCVSTQRVLASGRPDIAIEWPQFACYIEAKLSSYLHTDQLVPYGHDLAERRSAQPAFATRLAILTPRSTVSSELEVGISQLRSAGVEIELLGIEWEQVARLIRDMLETPKHPASFTHHASGFCDWIDLMVGAEFPPLLPSQVQALADRTVGIAVATAYRLTDLLQAEITQIEGATVLLNKWSRSKDYYGFQIVMDEAEVAWVGVWLGPWAMHGISPLWFEFKTLQVPSGTNVLEFRPLGEKGNYKVVPLKLRPAEREMDAARRLTAQISNLIAASEIA